MDREQAKHWLRQAVQGEPERDAAGNLLLKQYQIENAFRLVWNAAMERAKEALPVTRVTNGTSGPYTQGWRAGVEDSYAVLCRLKEPS